MNAFGISKFLYCLIMTILKDLSSSKSEDLSFARDTLLDKQIVDALIESGCPEKFINVMKDSVELSPVQRKYIVSVLKKELKKIGPI